MSAPAVADAQRNAEINGIKNCKFVCAKVIKLGSPDNIMNSFAFGSKHILLV